jgi:hypothetical protein
MIAKSSIAVTSQSCTATPRRVTGKPNQIRLKKSAKPGHFSLKATTRTLVPRLCLGTRCLRGSASRISRFDRRDRRQSLQFNGFPGGAGGAWEPVGGVRRGVSKTECKNTPSETIEILERFARTRSEFDPLASASVGMACALLVVAAFALSAIQVHAWLEAQLQLNATDFVRVFAGL